MWIDAPNARLELNARSPLRLDEARGTLLRAVKGTLWITLDDDRRDIVLDPGESYVVDSDARLLVLPLSGRATVDVCDMRASAFRRDASRHASAHRRATPASASQGPGLWARARQALVLS